MNTGTVEQASGNPIKINQRIFSGTDATNHLASDMELEASDNFLDYYHSVDMFNKQG